MKPFADVRSEERSVGMAAPDSCYRRRNDPIGPFSKGMGPCQRPIPSARKLGLIGKETPWNTQP
jgi:hypothetical protein